MYIFNFWTRDSILNVESDNNPQKPPEAMDQKMDQKKEILKAVVYWQGLVSAKLDLTLFLTASYSSLLC